MPTWVVGVVDKALSFKKEDRFASANDMRMAVRSAFAQLKDAAEGQVAPGENAPAEIDPSREVSAIFDAIMEPSVIVELSFAGAPPTTKD